MFIVSGHSAFCFRRLLPVLFVLLLVSGLRASTPSMQELDAEKASYIFIEAAAAYNDERYTDAYMLLRRAATLAPEDAFIGGEMAEYDLRLPTMTPEMSERSYSMLKRRFLAAPDDDTYGQAFAHAAGEAGKIEDVLLVWATLDSLHPENPDNTLNHANALLYKGMMGDSLSLRRSLDIYTAMQEHRPGDVGLTSYKVRALSATRDSAAVIRELERLYESAPSSVQVNLYVGDAYAHMMMDSLAMKYLDHALELAPESGMVYRTRAAYFEEREMPEEFDREVFNALETSDLDFESKLGLLLNYVRGLFDKPETRPRIDRMFEKMLDIHPGEARLHGLYGAYEQTLNNTEAAAEQYGYALDLNPEDEEMWKAYLTALTRLAKTNEVIQTCRDAMRNFPDVASFALFGAGNLSLNGRNDEALALLDSIPMSAYENPEMASTIKTSKADILVKMGRQNEGFELYRSAIALNPANAMAMNNYAYFMALDSVDLEQATVYAARAVEAEEDNPTYLDTYAWVMFRRKEFKEAKALIDRALALYELEEEVDSVYIDTADISGQVHDVAEEVELVEEFQPSAEIYDHAGDIYFFNGYLKEALEYWKQAAALKPEDELIKRKVKYKTYFPE